jgi:hypothetical protein
MRVTREPANEALPANDADGCEDEALDDAAVEEGFGSGWRPGIQPKSLDMKKSNFFSLRLRKYKI